MIHDPRLSKREGDSDVPSEEPGGEEGKRKNRGEESGEGVGSERGWTPEK